MRPRAQTAGAILVACLIGAGGATVDAQSTLRKATTLLALNTYPVFFHGEPVVVRAEAWFDDDSTWLLDGEERLLWLGTVGADADRARVEAMGTFWDVGRLPPDDPRLAAFDLASTAEAILEKPWPSPGELLILIGERSEPAPRPIAPTLRTVALTPGRYTSQEITVAGRFRGRNLYGDLPQAPAQSLTDFVLHSADAALWITGKEPRGRDFSLNIDARVDTGKWLEVTGTVRQGGGLVWLEASLIDITTAEDRPEPVIVERALGPPPEVIFSAPVQDDVDVPLDSLVRLQFSRDMDAGSFRGRVQVGYLGGTTEAPPFTFRYRGGNRVLELRFEEPLVAFATLRVELLGGLEAFDGAIGEAWQLTFTLGGSPAP